MSQPVAVLLHGANGCAAELEPLAAPLRSYARVIVHDLPGHGGRPLPERLGIGAAADDVIAMLAREGIERAIFVGYSLGGYAALYLARHYPARTVGACALAAKFDFDAQTVDRWAHLAQPERLARPGNPRAEEMLKAHGPEWKSVTAANARLFRELGENPEMRDADYAAISRPVLLVNSSRDPLVPWAETLRVGKLVPGARLVMFYGMAHPLRNVPIPSVAKAIGEWMEETAKA
jgi:pimeloyl-ACP methyl ester carboxylesterase